MVEGGQRMRSGREEGRVEEGEKVGKERAKESQFPGSHGRLPSYISVT